MFKVRSWLGLDGLWELREGGFGAGGRGGVPGHSLSPGEFAQSQTDVCAGGGGCEQDWNSCKQIFSNEILGADGRGGGLAAGVRSAAQRLLSVGGRMRHSAGILLEMTVADVRAWRCAPAEAAPWVISRAGLAVSRAPIGRLGFGGGGWGVEGRKGAGAGWGAGLSCLPGVAWGPTCPGPQSIHHPWLQNLKDILGSKLFC